MPKHSHHHHHHHIYSPQNKHKHTKNIRGRLPERPKHPSTLAALTTKWYNTNTQMHKNIKKRITHPVHKPTTVTLKSPFSCGIWSHLMHGSLGPHESTPKRHLGQLSCFCRGHGQWQRQDNLSTRSYAGQWKNYQVIEIMLMKTMTFYFCIIHGHSMYSCLYLHYITIHWMNSKLRLFQHDTTYM